MSLAASEPEAAIWQRTLEPEAGNLTPEAAHAFLRLSFTPEDHRAMDDLAAKAQAGSLTPEESRTLEGYRHVAWLLGLLKSKARRSLQLTSGTT